MIGIVKNIRGFAQSIIRGAVAVGMKAVETFETLKASGLGYIESQFRADFEAYDVQPFLMDEIYTLREDYIIPVGYHQETDIGITFPYKYDIQATYMDAKGITMDLTRSVVSNERMTLDEIMEEAAVWEEETPDEGWQPFTDWELIGSWKKK